MSSKVALRAGTVPTLGSESHSAPAMGRVPLEDAGPVGKAPLVGKRQGRQERAWGTGPPILTGNSKQAGLPGGRSL